MSTLVMSVNYIPVTASFWLCRKFKPSPHNIFFFTFYFPTLCELCSSSFNFRFSSVLIYSVALRSPVTISFHFEFDFPRLLCLSKKNICVSLCRTHRLPSFVLSVQSSISVSSNPFHFLSRCYGPCFNPVQHC